MNISQPLTSGQPRGGPLSQSSAVLHLLCGPIAAGKSTLARRLARRLNARLISEDQWLPRFFAGGINNLYDYVNCSRRLQILFAPYCLELLQEGRDVVFDFPVNSPELRAWLKQHIDQAGARHFLHYVTAPAQECRSRLIKRINSSDQFVGDELLREFDEINSRFIPPDVSEGFNVEVNW